MEIILQQTKHFGTPSAATPPRADPRIEDAQICGRFNEEFGIVWDDLFAKMPILLDLRISSKQRLNLYGICWFIVGPRMLYSIYCTQQYVCVCDCMCIENLKF